MSSQHHNPFRIGQLLIFTATLLTGCASLPEDHGQQDVLVATHAHAGLPPDQAVEDIVASRQEIDVHRAVYIALANNPSFQQSLASLGFGAAEVYAANRLSNPIFSISRLTSSQSGLDRQLTVGIAASLADWLTRGKRKAYAENEFAALKKEITHVGLQLVKQTRSAYFEYIYARDNAYLLGELANAADVSLRLSQKFAAAGNFSDKQVAEIQVSAAQAKIEHLAASHAETSARATLADLLGLQASANWQAAVGVPRPLTDVPTLDELIAFADQNRMDLQAAKIRAKNLADLHRATQWTRWIDQLDLGYEREREVDGGRLRGPTLEATVPIFSQNKDQLIHAEAKLAQALSELEETHLTARNAIWHAHAAVETAAAQVAVIEQQLIPGAVHVTQRAEEEQAFMLIGVFELMQHKMQEYQAYQQYLAALLDYWLAYTNLSHQIGGHGAHQFGVSNHFDITSQFSQSGVSPESHEHLHHSHGGQQ